MGSPAGTRRFAAASPCTPPYFPSTGISLHEASTRVQAIRPSGLPLACGRSDGTSRPWAFPRASHPADHEPDNARRGGDRPSSTDLELPAQLTSSISNPVVHSMRATSRRTPNRRRPLRSEQRDVRRGPLTGGPPICLGTTTPERPYPPAPQSAMSASRRGSSHDRSRSADRLRRSPCGTAGVRGGTTGPGLSYRPAPSAGLRVVGGRGSAVGSAGFREAAGAGIIR
jgi:hypothetical protein